MLEENTSFQMTEKGFLTQVAWAPYPLVSFAPEYPKGHCKGGRMGATLIVSLHPRQGSLSKG